MPLNMNMDFKCGSMWTYDLTYHIMVDLKMAIALATMTFMKGTNLHELHPMNERVFHDFIKQ